ncbi:MAG: N-acetylmuramoyl-L-alanine amidase, partial [Chloroflexi bacterium]
MSRRSIFLVLLAFLPALLSVQGTSAANLSFGVAMQSAAAARQVPLPIVEAVAWVNSRWEWIPQPSVDGGVGPMNIHPYDLELAASLSGHDPALLRTDLSANLDAGAAFLAHYHGSGTDLASWRPAVAMLLGDGAATEVFDALRSGASRVTNEGEAISLTPQSVPAGKAPAALPRSGDYPPANWVAASPANYSSANRPHDWPIDLIVIHDTEGSYASAIAEFQNPAAQSSAHFVVSTGGAITQMVREQDVAWHAGNWDYNTRSVGIEHEGYAWSCCWYTTAQYNSSAGISASICSRFGVPMDRSHVIGHSDVPDPN